MKKMSALMLSVLLFSGCGGSADKELSPTPQATSPAPSPLQVVPIDPATRGAIKGKVTFAGQVPAPRELPMNGNPECSSMHKGPVYSDELLVKDGAVQNSFVYIKSGLASRSFTPPTESALMDNKACVYVPRVMGVQVNQPVILQNSDATLHNVHSYGKANKSFNLGLPFQGMKQTKKFTAPEVMVTMKCDVHPWMLGYIGVLEHPYFAVTSADGTFELKNLPPGEYVVEAWHEKLGVQSQTVRIEPREAKEIVFNYPG